MGYTPLQAFTPVSGVSIADTSNAGVVIEELSTTGGISINDLGAGAVSGGIYFASSRGIEIASGNLNASWLFTGTNLAGLPTPTAPETPAFGLTQDGKIYFYPTGGPWALKAPAEPYTTSIITANPNPGVVGTYYETNYAASGNFTLPTSPATGSWILLKQVASNTLSLIGTVDGVTNFTLARLQSVQVIYNGTSWSAN